MARWNEDVIRLVCDVVDEPADLARLALVHRSWTGPARSALYRSVRFDYDTPVALARVLAERPGLAELVRKVYFKMHSSSWDEMCLVRGAIGACRNLLTLEVWLGKYADPDRILAPCLPDLVRRLPLRNVALHNCQPDVLAGVLSHELDWLTFEVPVGFVWHGRATLRAIDGLMSPNTSWSSLYSVVAASAETLEELRITDGRWDETGALVKMLYGRMPRLRRLLVRLDDLTPPFMDDILAAHPQLEALALDSCSFTPRLIQSAVDSAALHTLVVEDSGTSNTLPIVELESALRRLPTRPKPPLRVLAVFGSTRDVVPLWAEADRLGIQFEFDHSFYGYDDQVFDWPVAVVGGEMRYTHGQLESPPNARVAAEPPTSPAASSSSSAVSTPSFFFDWPPSPSDAGSDSAPSSPSGSQWSHAHAASK